MLREISDVKSDVTCAAQPARRLAKASVPCQTRTLTRCEEATISLVSKQCLLWCSLRCEIPLFNILFGIPLTEGYMLYTL